MAVAVGKRQSNALVGIEVVRSDRAKNQVNVRNGLQRADPVAVMNAYNRPKAAFGYLSCGVGGTLTVI